MAGRMGRALLLLLPLLVGGRIPPAEAEPFRFLYREGEKYRLVTEVEEVVRAERRAFPPGGDPEPHRGGGAGGAGRQRAAVLLVPDLGAGHRRRRVVHPLGGLPVGVLAGRARALPHRTPLLYARGAGRAGLPRGGDRAGGPLDRRRGGGPRPAAQLRPAGAVPLPGRRAVHLSARRAAGRPRPGRLPHPLRVLPPRAPGAAGPAGGRGLPAAGAGGGLLAAGAALGPGAGPSLVVRGELRLPLLPELRRCRGVHGARPAAGWWTRRGWTGSG